MPTATEQTTPAHVALLRAFANTVDVEGGTDGLTEPAALGAWLREQGILPAGCEAGEADLVTARALRDGIRVALAAHHDHDEPVNPTLDTVASGLPLRLAFPASGPRLEPVEGGVRGALARLLVAVSDARADRTWQRLKLCRAGDCQWAFFDTSKNRARTWCAMGVCGNRTKTRAYRARRRAAQAG